MTYSVRIPALSYNYIMFSLNMLWEATIMIFKLWSTPWNCANLGSCALHPINNKLGLNTMYKPHLYIFTSEIATQSQNTPSAWQVPNLPILDFKKGT